MQVDERLGVNQVAYLFAVREATVYSWIKRKADFPARGDDGKWSALEINEYAARHSIPTRRR